MSVAVVTRVAAPLACLLVLSGCVSTGGAPDAAYVGADTRPFLLSPLRGYPYSVDVDRRGRLESAHAALMTRGDATGAADDARELLAWDRAFHPATVLAAQAALVGGRPDTARDMLLPFAGELPGYLAAQLVLGRAAELADDPVTAFAAYERVAADSSAAAERTAVLRPRAVEIVVNRADDALGRGRADAAARELARLRTWAPDDRRTFQIERRVAVALGDSRQELAAVRRLVGADGDPGRELAERHAELEIEVGDAGVGLQGLEELAARHPQDVTLQAKLESAKFRWRVVLLPPDVRGFAGHPELTRGQFAALLFWLFPEVRYGRASQGRIANDVFDHPQREEIVRVVNLELMDVEPRVHRFRPEESVTRAEALEALLRVMEGQDPQPSCVATAAEVPEAALDASCRLAARCRLTESPDDCLPGSSLSGEGAVELVRRALEQLGQT